MIAISAKNLSKSYGIFSVFEDINFTINTGEKVGIVGANGAGKTTLLNILSSENQATSGSFFIAKNLTLGYLKQSDIFEDNLTLIDAARNVFKDIIEIENQLQHLQKEIDNLSLLLENSVNGSISYEEIHSKLTDKLKLQESLIETFEKADGYQYNSEIKGILNNLGFDESRWHDAVSSLSGGQKTRLAIACLLLRKPDILLLDEPTNHLDINTLAWFEGYIRSYSGTVVIISHDRYFLDKTVDRIFEVTKNKLNIYEGNYSFFAKEKKARLLSAQKQYDSWKREQKRQEEMIQRFKQHGTEKLAKRAASREKRLANEEVMQAPIKENHYFNIKFEQTYKSGNDVLYVTDLTKSFGYGTNLHTIFSNVSFDVKRGQKICIIGSNGVGKSTLLKTIIGEIAPSQGNIKIGHNVKIGYYDQSQQKLNEDLTPFEELHNEYPTFTHGQVRSYLGRFLFDENLVFTPIKALSGGQKARLCLLKLMLSGANLLILDEPTNHLDIESKEIIESAISEFEGTALIVSHDRYLLSKLPDEILELKSNGIIKYLGKYEYYLEKRDNIMNIGNNYDTIEAKADKIITNSNINSSNEKTSLSNQELRQLQKEQEREQRKRQREKQSIEDEIEKLENEIFETEQLMCEPDILSDAKKLYELNDSLIYLKDQLEKHYEKWLQYEND
ncbi:MAG: ABC-F family ATP-binding cassette domain-containing protein [Eubacteriales bacterium]|nr:ABC-F family ATP-binding cassette domain-containing protein [Eubacteriales bacterium]MDY3332353.1 ABC-F family ATP-binding cassette domain-containing protein [Gallibacter sp.]